MEMGRSDRDRGCERANLCSVEMSISRRLNIRIHRIASRRLMSSYCSGVSAPLSDPSVPPPKFNQKQPLCATHHPEYPLHGTTKTHRTGVAPLPTPLDSTRLPTRPARTDLQPGPSTLGRVQRGMKAAESSVAPSQ